MAYAFAFRRFQHFLGLGGVPAERPFAVDVFPGIDRRHHRAVMVRHLHGDGDQIDTRMPGKVFRVRKRQRYPEMPRRRVGRFLAGRGNGGDFEVGKRMQRWDMRDRGKPPLGAQPDNTDTYFTAVSHRILHITSGRLQNAT